ncbi:hypothetical protein [Chitinophaga defluvii]|uniref:DUF1896 family protein n=1 Tax=Chitinophaga defluvii TaxID=3163343 RepID=A0ABV2T6P5_9BACT
MFHLQEDYSVTRYLEEKVAGILPTVAQLLSENRPAYVIEELCLNAMTEELKPSRYRYLRSVLEEDFNTEYEAWKESGTLTYELCNLIETCKEIFDGQGFSSANEQDRYLRYAIIGQVQAYLVE